MSTRAETAEFLVDQLSGAGAIHSTKMFGEYAVYCDGKVIAFICDDQLFIKPTAAGREFAPECEDAPPYPGAKLYLLVDPAKWDDRDWLTELVTRTYAELPEPKPKAPRKPKG
ncbi:MAG TPA: TfoX/Sxy family protein [Candidatus Lumbricidophila sp.]|nr:TfoX/Sxy family protein [Candidatus Lumbricidophila sp.]